jgi:hypothetical protein
VKLGKLFVLAVDSNQAAFPGAKQHGRPHQDCIDECWNLISVMVITVLGLMSMAAGGRTDEEFSTPLMWARVGAHGLTILLLVIAVLTR